MILFSRKKVGRKTISFFQLSPEREENQIEGKETKTKVKSMLLSEKFEANQGALKARERAFS